MYVKYYYGQGMWSNPFLQHLVLQILYKSKKPFYSVFALEVELSRWGSLYYCISQTHTKYNRVCLHWSKFFCLHMFCLFRQNVICKCVGIEHRAFCCIEYWNNFRNRLMLKYYFVVYGYFLFSIFTSFQVTIKVWTLVNPRIH